MTVLFEIEKTVAQDRELRQRVAYLVRHGAQILADDDVFASDTFERQDPHQVNCVVTNVNTFGSAEPLRYPEQTEEAHHMVDAERSARANHFPNALAVQVVAVFPVF